MRTRLITRLDLYQHPRKTALRRCSLSKKRSQIKFAILKYEAFEGRFFFKCKPPSFQFESFNTVEASSEGSYTRA